VIGEYGCWRNNRLLFLQGDGSLEDGVCVDLSSMDRVPATDCAVGFAAAETASRISSDVLENDLQGRLHSELVRAAKSPL
jgi:hypothetical protein